MFEMILALAVTQHVGLEGDFNSVHPYLQLRHESGLIAGAYLNSESTGSAYAGYRFEGEAAFLEVGAVTGYSQVDVVPFVRAGLAFENGVEVFITPAFQITSDGEEHFGAAIGVSYSFR